MSARKKKKTATGAVAVSSADIDGDGGADDTSKMGDGMQQCAAILKQIQAKSDAQPFLEAVDWQLWGLNDYPEIIKKPMDLGTVQKKLEGNKYNSIDKFAGDVRLVWKNAMTYNSDDSDIYKTAENLSKLFEKKFAKLKKASAPQAGASTAAAGAATAAGASQKRRDVKSEGTAGGIAAGSAGGAAISRVDKLKFSQTVNQLTSDQLGHVVSLIQTMCPDALNEEGDDVLEIEINNLDAATLSQLLTYSQSCISENASTKGRKKTSKAEKAA
jgi:hypothetical protein